MVLTNDEYSTRGFFDVGEVFLWGVVDRLFDYSIRVMPSTMAVIGVSLFLQPLVMVLRRAIVIGMSSV